MRKGITGQKVKGAYLQNRKEHIERILKPLRDRRERVYVLAGSRAEAKAGQNAAREVRVVRAMARSIPK